MSGAHGAGADSREPVSATTVLLALAVSLLVLAVPVGAAGVVTASDPLLVGALGLAGAAVAVLLACGLLAGARTTLQAHRRRLAEREAWQPPDERLP